MKVSYIVLCVVLICITTAAAAPIHPGTGLAMNAAEVQSSEMAQIYVNFLSSVMSELGINIVNDATNSDVLESQLDQIISNINRKISSNDTAALALGNIAQSVVNIIRLKQDIKTKEQTFTLRTTSKSLL